MIPLLRDDSPSLLTGEYGSGSPIEDSARAGTRSVRLRDLG